MLFKKIEIKTSTVYNAKHHRRRGAIELAWARAPNFLTAGARGTTQIYRAPFQKNFPKRRKFHI